MKIRLSVLLLAISFFQFQNSAYAQEQISLEQVIALALEKNYDVRLAKNTSEAYATDQGYAWAAFAPQVNGTAAITRNNNNQELRFDDATRNNYIKQYQRCGTTQLDIVRWYEDVRYRRSYPVYKCPGRVAGKRSDGYYDRYGDQ
jgi:outer membrane protein TolC